ncbi:Bleomycin resistance protein [Kordia antarctica]|uniref:Bleomycin resistance protein n=1 Tax=Kordia antarctica TaxID=1218801 RepID=A0A7L4ZR00_9FLAO|nr:glyoxalase superfamily protein [Kordia antarctica]QHI38927.1 Bleomycin resistance protein [Kordia antarctica]
MKAKAKVKFISVHPVLAVKNVIQSLGFYVNKLGFKVAFADHKTNPKYVGIKRGLVEIHLQQHHDASEWEHTIERPMLRFLVLSTENLFEEYKAKGIFHAQTSIKKTTWNTKEFAFYDLDKNGLTFYENL